MAAYHNYIYHQPTNLPGEHCSHLEKRLDGHEERGGSSKEEEFISPQAYCNEEQTVLYTEIRDRRLYKNVIHVDRRRNEVPPRILYTYNHKRCRYGGAIDNPGAIYIPPPPFPLRFCACVLGNALRQLLAGNFNSKV